MHGASVIALTMYDMLKPIDKQIEIGNIRLVEKKGGKSSYKGRYRDNLKAAVIVCSDAIAKGKKADTAGQAIVDKLKTNDVEVASYEIISDDIESIRNKATEYSQNNELVIFCGGTGLTSRDITPEALEPILERRVPGIEEAIRSYGQERMPYAMISRSIAGTINGSLVLALPGSTNGASESMDAIFPYVLHIFKVLR